MDSADRTQPGTVREDRGQEMDPWASDCLHQPGNHAVVKKKKKKSNKAKELSCCMTGQDL